MFVLFLGLHTYLEQHPGLHTEEGCRPGLPAPGLLPALIVQKIIGPQEPVGREELCEVGSAGEAAGPLPRRSRVTSQADGDGGSPMLVSRGVRRGVVSQHCPSPELGRARRASALSDDGSMGAEAAPSPGPSEMRASEATPHLSGDHGAGPLWAAGTRQRGTSVPASRASVGAVWEVRSKSLPLSQPPGLSCQLPAARERRCGAGPPPGRPQVTC